MEHKPIHKDKIKLKDLSLELPKDYQKINCPSCEKEVPAVDLNIHDKVGKCVGCNVLFPIKEHLDKIVASTKAPKQAIFRPEGIDVFRYKGDLEFTISSKFNSFEASLLGSLLLFLGLLILLLLKGAWIGFAFLIVPTLFFIIPFIVRSKIRVNIDERFLTIQHRPKYLLKDKSILTSNIDQVYVKKIEGSDSMCSVYIIVNTPEGQKHVKIIHLLYSYSKAKYIEQEIENHLGIIDREVP